MKDTTSKREDDALDALMAAAFRMSAPDERTDCEKAMKVLGAKPKLSPDDAAAIESLGQDFVEKLLIEGARKLSKEEGATDWDREIEDAYAAMNRGNVEESMSDQTRQEIERKRQELLGEDHKKENEADGS
jgi:hypothetical protein